MIRLENVSKYYSTDERSSLGLHNISIEFFKNEIVAITGDSGSGKTTLLNVLTQIDTYDEGEIYYKGNETSYFSVSEMDDFRKNKVGFIFQNYNIIESYTVLENVMLPLVLKGIPKKEAKKRALELIDKVKLTGKEKNRGSKLSGGEKQRCVIARALASDCEILACDEPTGNLDSETGAEIIELIKEVAKDKLVLIVTHNYEQVKDIVTRKITLVDGKIIQDQVFTPATKDENVPLDLDYKPLPKKIDLKLAGQGVIRTPKKSILLFTVFLIISVAILFSLSEIFSAITEETYYNQYGSTVENRLVVYNNNLDPINKDDLDSLGVKYSTNCYAEDNYGNLNYGSLSIYGYYACEVPNLTIMTGTLPDNEDEIFVVFPKTYKSEYDYYKGQEQKIIVNNGTSEDPLYKFDVVGVGYSDKIKTTYFIGGDLVSRALSANLSSYSVDLSISEVKMNCYAQTVATGTNKFTLYVPEELYTTEYLNSLKVDVTVNDTYIYGKDKVVIKKGSANSNFELRVASLVEDDQINVASIYANSAKTRKDITKTLIAKGYSVDYPVKIIDGASLTVILNTIFKLVTIISVGELMIGVFFFTYFILSRIYKSKITDYTILRTLGVTSKDMCKVVRIEISIIGVTCIALGFIINIFILKSVLIDATIAYLIMMGLFLWLMTVRFNKRLFKFSVSKSLRGDE